MKVNGEAIYATEASPFESLPWGRCTQKMLGDGRRRLYLHVFDWPADGKLAVPLRSAGHVQARLLADGRELTVTAGAEDLTLAVPAQAPDKIATVVALDVQP